MPSLGEAPSGGARTFWLLLGPSKSDPLSERNPKWPLPQEWICTRITVSPAWPPSRASPLPQLTACSFEYEVDCGFACTEELLFCGSWLACDADTSVHQVHRVDAIAGKPAPTFDRVWICCCCCCCCCSGPYILFDDEVSGLLICAFDLDLDLKSPRQTRWPESDSDWGGKPAGMPV